MSSAEGAQEPAAPTDPEAIRADIEATREQLARTVDELSTRLDVPARAKQTAARVRETALDSYLRNPAGVAIAGVGLMVLVVGMVGRRWKRSRARRKS